MKTRWTIRILLFAILICYLVGAFVLERRLPPGWENHERGVDTVKLVALQIVGWLLELLP